MSRNDSVISEIRRRVAASEPLRRVATSPDEPVELTGLSSEARALVVAALQEQLGRRVALVVASDARLDELLAALGLFHPQPDCVASWPVPSLSPYQEVTPSLAVVRDEVLAVTHLADGSADLLVVPARSLFSRLPQPEAFSSRITRLRREEEIDLHGLLRRLVENGYQRTDLVGEVGEFAFRGGILDIFSPAHSQPVRVELFGDSIESLRHFEVESQRSGDEVETLTIVPAALFATSSENGKALAKRLAVDFMDPLYKRDLAEKIDRLQESHRFPGIEAYLPLVSDSVPLVEWLASAGWLTIVAEPDEVVTSVERYEELLRNEYELAAGKGKAVYPPHVLLADASEVVDAVRRAPIAFSDLHVSGGPRREVRLRAPSAEKHINRLSELPAAIEAAEPYRILFVATRGGREKSERLLRELAIPFVDDPPRLGETLIVSEGNLPAGFSFEPAGLSLFSEWDLFEPPTDRRAGEKRKRSTEAFISDLRDLKIGDFIVHVDHGVARFRGLQRIPFGTTEREVMELEYADGGKLLLPMESLNLIQKYSGGVDAPPKLDKLGGTSWARTKASVRKAMRDMADELLKLYATRQMVSGYAFSRDTPWQQEFEEAFEFDETDDQLTAIEDIKGDMESRKPMDRLLCGDVGYGKTEVAMRAAFKAVMDSKQVAVLAPTTILSYQHYRTFLRRFASFPVSIELMTRFRSAKEQKEIARRLETGEIDVVVGTHRLLSKDVQFKDLGLLVIDEEQRFGVAQKERLKKFKKSIDVLAMSATPIPRTLHMSFAGIRDISVIETPPKDRLAIQTAVVPFKDDLIKEAIEFELARGGQVFFVHNRVDSIYAMKEYIEKLAPGVRVIVGHGQMDERELEKSMMAFIARQYDVLLATTIIENGIDIPSCNTILINHAEKFGLSQLYQLRGRVGRSDRLAFCYLVVPSEKVLSSDARKRLAALQEFADLGAGFRIAAKDLEIRGAGNLLGGEQSGQIAAVGLEMYTKLLDEAVRELKGEIVEEEVETSVNLGLSIYIPRDYIEDDNLRLMFYKKLASARDEGRLEEIAAEMRDRFGPVPKDVERLIAFMRLRLLAQATGVTSIVRERSLVAVKFHGRAKIDPNRLLALLGENPQARFSPNGVLSLPVGDGGGDLISTITNTIDALRVESGMEA